MDLGHLFGRKLSQLALSPCVATGVARVTFGRQKSKVDTARTCCLWHIQHTRLLHQMSACTSQIRMWWLELSGTLVSISPEPAQMPPAASIAPTLQRALPGCANPARAIAGFQIRLLLHLRRTLTVLQDCVATDASMLEHEGVATRQQPVVGQSGGCFKMICVHIFAHVFLFSLFQPQQLWHP